MKFSVEWFPEGVSASRELRATASAIRLVLGDSNVSAFVDRATNLAYAAPAVPAYIIAEAFARNWWRITAGRDTIFRLRKARLGYAIPDLTIRTNGVHAQCEASPYSYDNPPISFFESGSEEIDIQSLESSMRDIVESVLEKLRRANITDSPLSERWDDINRSMADDDERAFCEGAGALGVEPYTCTDAEAHAIEISAKVLNGDAYNEFLASQSATSVQVSLSWLKLHSKMREKTTILEVPKLDEPVRRTTARHAWEIGYSTAKTFRKKLGVKDSQKFRSAHSVAKLFGNPQFEAVDDRAPAIRAAVYTNGKTHFVLSALRAAEAKTFALARAIGDRVIFTEDAINLITDSESYRQAAGRAFAAEFLAPSEKVQETHLSGYAKDEIAAEFGVSTEVVHWQLENAPRIAATV